MTQQINNFEYGIKKIFRDNQCNIIKVFKNKRPDIKKGVKILQPLQSIKDFDNLASVNNYGITQTEKSQIIIFDLDKKNNNTKILKLFNRTRRKLDKENNNIFSKHGFIKVIDATHDELVKFTKNYNNTIDGLEIFAENHIVIFSGSYITGRNTTKQQQKSSWSHADDLHTSPIIEMKKAELQEIFSDVNPSNNNTKRKNTIKKQITIAREGIRHNAIIKELLRLCNELSLDTKKNHTIPLTYEMLYDSIIETEKIEGIKEYEQGRDQQLELKNMIEWCIDNYDASPSNFAESYLESQNTRFAHIEELGTNDQFNCWVWIIKKNTKYWSENSAKFILEKMKMLVSEDFNPTSGFAIETSRQIAILPQTLKVNLTNTDYNKKYQQYIINEFGQYYDLEKGEFYDVDPSVMFFKDVNLKVQYQENVNSPKKIFEFLKDRFSDSDTEILLNHLAGTLLHTSVLRAKPKILYIVGKTDTYKSLITEIFKKIIHHTQISGQSLEGIAERFGGSMVMNKMMNCLEEMTTKTLSDASNLKKIITEESGYVEVKNVPKQVYVNRFPRHLVLCNKLSSIPDDDDDNSIFIRSQYIMIKDIDHNIEFRDWRKELLNDSEEILNFTMWLLNRAYEIYTGIKPIIMQPIEESKLIYKKLTVGDFELFLKEKYDKTDDLHGTGFDYMRNDFKKFTNNTVSAKKLRILLDSEGLTHDKTRCYRDLKIPNMYSLQIDTIEQEHSDAYLKIVLGYKPKIKTVKSKIQTDSTLD